jgi:S-adenosylmethionine synthetase
MNTYLRTSESVSCAHPDKICDAISDAIVDFALQHDPFSRVAVETLVTADQVVLAGEVTCSVKIPFKTVARSIIKNLGYTKKTYGFTYKSPIKVYVHQQSPDIAQGVDTGGAGDQGLMFGYATDETPEFMPLPIMLAHDMVREIDLLKRSFLFLRPDGKSQATVLYKNEKPNKITNLVVAVPHDPKLSNKALKQFLINKALKRVVELRNMVMPENNCIVVNGTGKWEIGGPFSDTGVTGRKIIVDTYGGAAHHGGGCFSGKDPTKVDRSGAYAARYIAKNVVAKGFAKKCEVGIAYIIGIKEPIMRFVETFGTETVSKKEIDRYVSSLITLSVSDIVKTLNLRNPIYKKTAAYGHFGRKCFPWEKLVS